MLYLASQSPRRRELLSQLGVGFEVVYVDVPEIRAPGESPRVYVERVARAKARAGLRTVVARDPDAFVLGADTEVVLEDRGQAARRRCRGGDAEGPIGPHPHRHLDCVLHQREGRGRGGV